MMNDNDRPRPALSAMIETAVAAAATATIEGVLSECRCGGGGGRRKNADRRRRDSRTDSLGRRANLSSLLLTKKLPFLVTLDN